MRIVILVDHFLVAGRGLQRTLARFIIERLQVDARRVEGRAAGLGVDVGVPPLEKRSRAGCQIEARVAHDPREARARFLQARIGQAQAVVTDRVPRARKQRVRPPLATGSAPALHPPRAANLSLLSQKNETRWSHRRSDRWQSGSPRS